MSTLHDDLASSAAGLPIPPGDVDAVVDRARKRTTRRRRTVATLTTTAVIGVTAAAIGWAGRGGSTDTPVASSAGAVLSRGDVAIKWSLANATSALSWSNSVDGRYAVSTAPGETDVNSNHPHRVVYKSADGVDWTPVAELKEGQYLTDLHAQSNRIYAVGTGTAGANIKNKAKPPLVVGWSDDGGKTWS